METKEDDAGGDFNANAFVGHEVCHDFLGWEGAEVLEAEDEGGI